MPYIIMKQCGNFSANSFFSKRKLPCQRTEIVLISIQLYFSFFNFRSIVTNTDHTGYSLFIIKKRLQPATEKMIFPEQFKFRILTVKNFLMLLCDIRFCF